MNLVRHPSSPASPASAIQVIPTRLGDGKFSLLFAVSGEVGRIRIPTDGEGLRKDGLWKHSCFEAFLRLPGQSSYLELNFAPSGDWAAYFFDEYRSGMRPAEVDAPIVQCDASADQLGIAIGIDLAVLPEFHRAPVWVLAVAAVIESDDGSLAHWALAHPAGRPDFHHPDCFVLELPPADDE